jgi:hypothetical protein
MKTKLIVLACMLIAPLAFGQADTSARSSGPITQTKVLEPHKIGTVDSIAGSTVMLTSTAFSHPIKYILAKDVQYETADGKPITPDSVKPGTKVEIGFNEEGLVNRIRLIDLR